MKTSLSLGLIVAACSAVAACSSDEGTNPRGNAGTGPVAGGGGQIGVAGTSSGGSGGSSGSPSGGAGGGGNPAMGTLGEPLTITTEGVVDNANGTNINGGIAVTFSSVQVVEPEIELQAGGMCFRGTTATVPDPNSYGTHWGAEMIFDLNRVANPDAPPPGDAGADAGADAGPVLGQVAQRWDQGNVIGFAYTLVGNNPAAANQGVPNAQVRFKATPEGANPAQDNYCSNRTPQHNVRESVLFSDITFECWTEGNYTLAEDPIQYVQTPDPNKVVGTRPNPRAFRNVSWQISSDLMIPPIEYDFCVTDLRPILAP